MAVKLGSNIEAIRAVRQLGRTSGQLAPSLERLSSGQRINRASDDDAGLAIASTLRLDARVHTQGVRNLNDAISYLSIQDKGIESLKGIAIRIEELAEQGSSGTYSQPQRDALDKEAKALQNEWNRTLSATSFNAVPVLSGAGTELNVQGGYGTGEALNIQVANDRSVGVLTFQTTGYGDSETLTVADFDRDGKPDFAVTGTGGGVMVMMNRNGSIQQSQAISYTVVGGPAIAAVDLNNDARLDLVAASDAGEALYAMLGNGDGTFQAVTSYPTFGGLYNNADLAAGDFNGDGLADVIVGGTHSIWSGDAKSRLFLGNGNGTFRASISINLAAGAPESLMASDLDGNGTLDLGVIGFNGVVAAFTNDGAGNFTQAWGAPTTASASGTFGDINNDSVLDIAWEDAASNVWFALGNGNGTFRARTVAGAVGGLPLSINVADFDGDGNADLALGSYNATAPFRIMRGNGNGTFNAPTTINGLNSFTVYPRAFAVADWNGDGVPDLIGGRGSGNVAIQDTALGAQAIPRLQTVNLASKSASLQTLDDMRSTIDSLNGFSSKVGAAMSRVQSMLRGLMSQCDNEQQAAARISDADIAMETSNLARAQILQQLGSAVLAHANQEPQLTLQLLRG